MYKINHKNEDEQKVLENFYNMAKDSIIKGYNEALKFLGPLPEDVSTLAEGTYKKTLEKLDAWFKNGGKDIEDTIETENNKNVENTTKEITSNNKISTEELLKESELIKNQVVKLLEEQGIKFKQTQEINEKNKIKLKEEQDKQKSILDLKV